MHGVMMPTNLAGKYLDEAEFKPFWDALATEGKPLFLHPANAPASQLEQVFAASKNSLAHRQHFGTFTYCLLLASLIATRTSSSSPRIWVV